MKKILFLVVLFLVACGGEPVVETVENVPVVEQVEVEVVGAGGLLPEEVFENNANAVFTVGGFVNGEFVGNGSGFFINAEGAAISNHHVMAVARLATHIETHEGEHFEIQGFYFYDMENDLAVFQVEGRGFEFVTLGNPESLAVGQAVYAIGTPHGMFRNAFTIGNVASLSETSAAYPYMIADTIMFTAPIAGGNSGGPLFNTNGEVIGVNQAGFTTGQPLNFAVPIDRVDFLSVINGTLNALPVPPFGASFLGEDLFDFLVGTWFWDGGYYTLNADGTGSRDWSVGPGTFTWDFNAADSLLVIYQGLEVQNFFVTAVGYNEFEISGFRFTRSGETADLSVIVGEWIDIDGDIWEFTADGRFEIFNPQTGQNLGRGFWEQLQIVVHNENSITASGWLLDRLVPVSGVGAVDIVEFAAGEWIDIDGDIWAFTADGRFQITNPRTGQGLGSGFTADLQIVVHNENSMTANGWVLERIAESILGNWREIGGSGDFSFFEDGTGFWLLDGIRTDFGWRMLGGGVMVIDYDNPMLGSWEYGVSFVGGVVELVFSGGVWRFERGG